MTKIIRRVVSLLLAIVLSCTQLPANAATFGQLEQNTAYAGASASLSNYFSREENASDVLMNALNKVSSIYTDATSGDRETLEETSYEKNRWGLACVEGAVNIRESATTLSTVIGKYYMGEDVNVVGEWIVNGNLWYRVRVAEDVYGYVLAVYVLFGEEADAWIAAYRKEQMISAKLPEEFDIYESLVGLSVRDELVDLKREINACLKEYFPAAEEKKEYLTMYSVLASLTEYYQRVMDLAKSAQLQETYSNASMDLVNVNFTMSKLKDTTGDTDETFLAKIAEAKRKRAEQEAYSFGERVANYAATFVGILPYVWGGASLTHGADCSGFVGCIMAKYGLLSETKAKSHGYDSYSLRSVGYEVKVSQIQPGDIVCYQGHVAIYYGDGIVVHEPSRGRKAEFGNLYMMPILTVRRLITVNYD